MKKDIKIAFLTNMITPYRVGFFEALNRLLMNKLVVYPFTYREGNRGWPVKLPNNTEVIWSSGLRWRSGLDNGNFAERHLNFRLLKDLLFKNWRVVIIGGYDTPNSLFGFAIAKIRHIPVVLWSGSTSDSEIGKKSRIKKAIKKIVFKKADIVVSYGTQSTLLAQKYGAEKVFPAYNSVDNEYYKNMFNSVKNSRKNSKKNVRFLFVGQLIERKGVLELLDAYQKLREDHDNISLTIVGSGSLKSEIQNKITNIPDAKYLGPLYRMDLVKAYAEADVVCMPSKREVWGLVVNEAMLAGNAIIATGTSGAAFDLVVEGKTGFVIGHRRLVDELERTMAIYAVTPGLAQEHGKKGLELIDDITQENAAKAFQNAIEYINA